MNPEYFKVSALYIVRFCFALDGGTFLPLTMFPHRKCTYTREREKKEQRTHDAFMYSVVAPTTITSLCNGNDVWWRFVFMAFIFACCTFDLCSYVR